MTILESVARAICYGVDCFDCDNPDDIYKPLPKKGRHPGISEYVDLHWDEYVLPTKAAIQALIDADVPIDMSNNNHHVVNQRRDISTFKAMLKQILEEGE